MSLTFEGTIATELESGKAKNGRGYIKFSIRTKKELVSCISWDESIVGRSGDLKLDTECLVKGFYGKPKMDGLFEAPKELVVTYLRTKEESDKSSAIESEMRSFGGKDKYTEFISEARRRKEEAGYIRVPLTGDGNGSSSGIHHWWVRREDAVETSNGWVYWGEFIYDQCPKEKREALTECFKGFMRGHGGLSGIIETDSTKHQPHTSLADFSAWKAKAIARAREIYNSRAIPSGELKVSELNPQEKTWEQKVAEANII